MSTFNGDSMNIFWLGLLGVASAQTKSAPLNLSPHHKYDSPPKQEAMLEKELIQTREKTVVIDGLPYKQIEYQGKIFQVSARQADMQMDCRRSSIPPETFAVDTSVTVTQYSRLFLETLRLKCNEKTGTLITMP